MSKRRPKHYGKHTGTVINNIDPLQIGRLQVQVPDVTGAVPLAWAMPCFPLAGQQMGIYLIPPIGANVWVEFEQGDPDKPIWSGCWFSSAADVPALALAGNAVSPNIVIQSTGQNALVISDAPGPNGGLLLKSTVGATITINDVGVSIQNGKGARIDLLGPSVNINNGKMVI